MVVVQTGFHLYISQKLPLVADLASDVALCFAEVQLHLAKRRAFLNSAPLPFEMLLKAPKGFAPLEGCLASKLKILAHVPWMHLRMPPAHYVVSAFF
jgi:hypothetical protein